MCLVGLTMFLVKKVRKIKYGLRAQFQILILALQISSTSNFSLIQILNICLIVEFAKTNDLFRRCYIQCIYIKKENIKLFFNWLIFFITF